MRRLPVLAAAAVALAAAGPASAEPTVATAKGISGGALLGGELVMLVEAAFGVQPGWAYLVGGVAGATAGGFGGYYVEGTGDAKLSMYLLAAGMALVIPTTIVVLGATHDEPPLTYTQDDPPADEPPAEGAPPDARLRRVRLARAASPPARLPPPSLVGLRAGALTLSVPAVEVRERFTPTEVAALGQRQRTEVRIPMLRMSF